MKTIRFLAFIAALASSLHVCAAVTHVVVSGGNTLDIPIAANQRLIVRNFGATGWTVSDGFLFHVIADPQNSANFLEFLCSTPQAGLAVYGPSKLRIKSQKDVYNNMVSVMVSYELETYSSGFTPLGAAVIPSNSTGDFAVVMESSTDLQTWAPALSGTYSSAASPRFFRVKIVGNAP